MANSADPDQLASSEANWSGSTLFGKAGYIRFQQDKGYYMYILYMFHFSTKMYIPCTTRAVVGQHSSPAGYILYCNIFIIKKIKMK